MNIWDIILNLALAALGVIFALWYENLGAPRLIILPYITTQDKKGNGLTTRFLHLKVKNSPRKFPFVTKQTANACHGNIIFLTEKYGQTGKSIQFKWDGTPEPIKQEILNNQVVYLPDRRLIRATRFIDIAPDEEESLAIAFRIQGDSDAYGWSFLNYQILDWRYPESILPLGNYIARITITSGDTVVKKDFPFTNPENFEEFDLMRQD